ncbi:hypothetical protein NW801_08630 [Brevibacillus laterosporus]|uniref:Lipoprotein n=1 Tax=Brevibacillus halotolerans TaxID=1507437 RepID=A0ABT4HVN3_9BACL|nr:MULTISPECIES: hypothetical protein [Brevibacillus]MCR8985134.1 hypothetical protein [Brevibacillus laterosporus]MCZ0830863.1 hypothetical protein [Brevibacillus halotolerans]GIO00232.1 hypothetical protein J5TS2_09000 [Brevibacillus halotolerans]
MKKLISILTLALAIICFISTESPKSDSNAASKKIELYSIQKNHYDPGY